MKQIEIKLCDSGLKLLFFVNNNENIINNETIKEFYEHAKYCKQCSSFFNFIYNEVPLTLIYKIFNIFR